MGWGRLRRVGTLIVLVSGCLEGGPPPCADGIVCAADRVCAPAGGSCVEPAWVQACEGIAPGAACTLAGLDDGVCRDGVCRLERCGNGVLEGAEACDEGAANANDRACTLGCEPARCGDGLVHAGVEGCDDGAANADAAACTSTCAPNVCGDGRIWAEREACDDGGAASGDGCRSDCAKVEVCGDALLDAGEACDDGNANPGDGCDACVATRWRAAVIVAGSRDEQAVQLNRPFAVTIDDAGTLYVADSDNHVVRRLTPTGESSIVAGNGLPGASGDGGPATSARVGQPAGVAVDGAGNLYIACREGAVRRVDGSTGDISTWVDVDARGLAVDGLGQLYVADRWGDRILRVDSEGVVSPLVLSAGLNRPYGIALSAGGGLFVAEMDGDRVVHVDVDTGDVTTIAGLGDEASGPGDGGPALNAFVDEPQGVAVDAQGNLYIAERGTHRLRRVDHATGTISTVAGDGAAGQDGDGGPPASARLSSPSAVAVGPDGAVYVADRDNHRIRRIDPSGAQISTALGGVGLAVGDGGAATAARFRPHDLATGNDGSLYLVSGSELRVRKVGPDGVISTIAGTGTFGTGGDGGAAILAQFKRPRGVAVDDDDNVFVVDEGGGGGEVGNVRRIDAATGLIDAVGGSALVGTWGIAVAPNGDLFTAWSGPSREVLRWSASTGLTDVVARGWHEVEYAALGEAGSLLGCAREGTAIERLDLATSTLSTVAEVSTPERVTTDAAGNLYIVNFHGRKVMRLDAVTDELSTFAGTGVHGFTGDGGPATEATLGWIRGLATTDDGAVYIADESFDVVRRVDPVTREITTVAGAVDPLGVGPIAQARLADPRALAIGPGATTFVAGGSSGTLLAVREADGWVEVGAGRYPQPDQDLGVPAPGPMGDRARYRGVAFGDVAGVAYDPSAGRIYLAETTGHRIHVIDPVDPADRDTWTIALLAGDGTAGFADGPGAAARFREPAGLWFDGPRSRLLVADTGNHVIRAIALPGGEVTTVAGTPAKLGYAGDGGAATVARLHRPAAIAVCPSGDLFIADTANHRIRRVATETGAITTVLGDGAAASSGEGAPSTSYPVDAPRGVTCDAVGNVIATSSATVRSLAANSAGVVDGSGAVSTIYGRPPRDEFPQDTTACLTGIVVVDATTLRAVDACAGMLLDLRREPATPP